MKLMEEIQDTTCSTGIGWKDPNKELPDYYKKVQLKVKHNEEFDYVNACLLVNDNGGLFFCDYNYGIYVQFKHVIGWKPIE